MSDAERPGFFKDYHKNVRKNTSNDQFNQFSKLSSDEERFTFLFSLPAVHDIDIRTYFKGKSEKEALERKEAGNKAFGRKKNLEALKCYSQAVVKAPVPVEENADPKKMTLYAICLANRSAALFHMREIYFCVKDIDEALAHHYPKELKYKLFKRKARLLVELKRHEDARDSFRQALKWLDWAKMDREKRIDIQKDIQKWLSLFDSAKVLKNADYHEYHLLPPIPDVADGPSEQFPSLSKKVEVRYDNNKGRHCVAAEDLNTGDVVCTEKAYVYVLNYEQYGTHCQNCFAVTKAAIPCKRCSGVLFCTAECRDAAYFHYIECPVIDLLHGSGMSINCFLALRMLTQTPFNQFLSVKDQLIAENHKDLLEKTNNVLGSNFLHVYNLCTHADKRTPEDFFHRTLMAVFMIKALKKTKYFEEKGTSLVDKLTDNESFAGGLLLRFLQIIQFNAHEVSEFMLPSPKSLDSAKNETIGAALYGSLALFNHSCNSALVRYFSGNHVITKAIRQIPKGAEVPENYGQCFTAHTRSFRRNELADRYWFECTCEPCLKDWPTFKSMQNNMMKFKCHKCQGPLPVNVETMNPFTKCSDCGDQTNILGALKNLQNSEQTFKAACKEMSDYELPKARALLEENLKQLDTALYPPYKDYHVTQEAYMRCCLADGNLRVRNNSNDSPNKKE